MEQSPPRERTKVDRSHSERQKIDMFSDLAKHLTHHIMSLLPTRDAARMSVLSTRFLAAWRSFPVFDFDYAWFRFSHTTFVDYLAFVQESIRNRQLESNHISSFSFKIDFAHVPKSVNGRDGGRGMIGEIVDFAMNNKVRELVLECLNKKYFCLPISVFSCGSIRTMRLSGFNFERRKNFVLSCPLIEVLRLEKWRSVGRTGRVTLSSARLKTAEFVDCDGLESIRIEASAASLESFSFLASKSDDKNAILNLIAIVIVGHCKIIDLGTCKSLKSLQLGGDSEITQEWFSNTVPNLEALEVLELRACQDVETVSLHSEHLRRVDFQDCTKIKDVSVVSESLEYFRHCLGSGSVTVQCRIDIARCNNLKELIVRGVEGNLTDEWIGKGFTRAGGFRSLQNLVLQRCNLLEELRFRSDHLKTMQLLCCEKLRAAEIEAPNLVSLLYEGAVLPPPRLIVTSVHLHAELRLALLEHEYENLRNFLSYFGHCKSLTLVCECDEVINLNLMKIRKK